MQKLAGKAVCLHAGVAQCFLDLNIHRYAGWVITSVPGDGLGACFFDKLFNCRECVALPENELAAELVEAVLQGGQGMMEPPLLCRTERSAAVRFRLSNIDGDDGTC